MISSYTADVIYNCGIFDRETGRRVELTKPEDVVGKKLTIGSTTYTIVGIIDSGAIPEKYEVLKESGNSNYTLISQMQMDLQDSLHLVAFVTEAQLGVVAEDSNNYYGMDDFGYRRLVAAAGLGDGAAYVFPEWGNRGCFSNF